MCPNMNGCCAHLHTGFLFFLRAGKVSVFAAVGLCTEISMVTNKAFLKASYASLDCHWPM